MRKHILQMDKTLLVFTVAMLIFGLLMIFSASNAMATVEYNDPYKYMIRQGIFLIGGFFISLIIIKIPTKRYYKLSILVIGVLIILLFGLDVFGEATRSTKSWIPIGPFNLQPSEFSKMAIIMVMAAYYEKMIMRNKTDMVTTAKPLLLGAVCFGLTALQPDFGTATIIAGVIVMTFVSLPLDKKLKYDIYKIVAGSVFLAIVLLLLLKVSGSNVLEEKFARFEYFEPCTRYQESTGYQVCNGYIAINNGGLTGVGLGNSTQKYLYLPEAHTDFIYPVIVEEWGLIGGATVIFMFLVILWRILAIAKHSSSLRGSILAYGVASYLFLHIVINLTGVLGILPLTGVPLPFLSYGGSSLLTLIIGLSIVQRVEIETNENIRRTILKKAEY